MDRQGETKQYISHQSIKWQGKNSNLNANTHVHKISKKNYYFKIFISKISKTTRNNIFPFKIASH